MRNKVGVCRLMFLGKAEGECHRKITKSKRNELMRNNRH